MRPTVQQSDPIGCSSAVLHHAAQPPGESAVGDGIEGKIFCEGCLLSIPGIRSQNAANVQVSIGKKAGRFPAQACGFEPQANPERMDILQGWIQ